MFLLSAEFLHWPMSDNVRGKAAVCLSPVTGHHHHLTMCMRLAGDAVDVVYYRQHTECTGMSGFNISQ